MRKIPGLAVLAVMAGVAAPAGAEDAGVGATLYSQYCATCHGAGAMGDGPLTELLSQTVPDLTKLAANNDGQFPMLEVIHIIDGRTGLRGHGGPMPTYGAIFMAEAESGVPGDFGNVLETRGRILSVAMYLETLQQ